MFVNTDLELLQKFDKAKKNLIPNKTHYIAIDRCCLAFLHCSSPNLVGYQTKIEHMRQRGRGHFF